MDEITALKTEVGPLVSEAGDVLDTYLRIDSQMFSWKNTFGWNDVAKLVPEVQPLIERLTSVLTQIKINQQRVAELPEEAIDRALLEQFYRILGNYTDTLKLAIQGMGRVLAHIETKRTNKAEFKQVRYESDLMIYKSQIDKYQLYGQQLNPLLRKLGSGF